MSKISKKNSQKKNIRANINDGKFFDVLTTINNMNMYVKDIKKKLAKKNIRANINDGNFFDVLTSTNNIKMYIKDQIISQKKKYSR